MAFPTKSVKRRIRHASIAVPSVFSRLAPQSTIATAALWQKHFDGDASATQALFDHYAPVCQIVAKSLKKHRAEFYAGEPLEDLVMDGAVGLFAQIGYQPSTHMRAGDNPPTLFLWQVQRNIERKIRQTIRAEVLNRRGFSRRYPERRGIIHQHRAGFVQEHGRLPDRSEMLSMLASEFTNPNIIIDERKPTSVSDCRNRKGLMAAMRSVPSSAAGPDALAMSREAAQLLMSSVPATDRKLMKMILRGDNAAAIATRLGVSKHAAYARMRGLLWEVRAKAEVASYVDETAIPAPTDADSARSRYWTDAVLFLATGDNGARAPDDILGNEPATTLTRAHRDSRQILELLRAGYTGRSIIRATIGHSSVTRVRVREAKLKLIVELERSPALKLAV